MRKLPVFPGLQETHEHYLDFRSKLSVFDEGECQRIIGMSEDVQVQESRIKWGENDQNERSTDIFWIHASEDNAWFYDRIVPVVRELNDEFFGFSLDGHMPGLQLGRYGPNQGYDWHADFGPGVSRRKLSLVVQLTHPDQYQGGELEFFRSDSETAKAPRDIGSLTVFPSFMLHRAARIRGGERWSLVTWLEGPPFR